ncbi:MAG: 3-carboxy-cis,cis-muconate cycloisomerase [Vicinamibacterales bacterium]
MTAVDRVPFSPAGRVQALLDVEVALVEALAEAGVVPAGSVAPIRAAARADRYDLDALQRSALDAGNLLIPVVSALTRQVATTDPTAAGHVHWGATSQDVIDTALVVQLVDAGAPIAAALARAAEAAAALADRHAATPMAGRTWLQQATPTTFGAKAAGWMQGLDRGRRRLADALAAVRVVQLAGASGTLSSLGDAGPAVAAALAGRLGLRVADGPWHTERSRVADLACALGVACGTLGKIGRDVTLLAQTEVGEVAEAAAPGRGGSSSMPHKQNPVASVRAMAAAVQAPGLVATMLAAMPQEHERAAGGWQAEWETLPALVALTTGAAAAVADMLAGLHVDPARMRANLDLAGGVALAEGLTIALARHVGRPDAARVVADACRRAVSSGQALATVAGDDPRVRAHLDVAAIVAALDPAAQTATARAVVARALAARRPVAPGADHG